MSAPADHAADHAADQVPVEPRAHGGRPLDDSRDAVILQAALEVLAEEGYDRLTIEAVAARAHAGKATVYRRWAGKAELVADAVGCVDEDLHGMDVDTGSLRGDLRAVFLHTLADADDFQIAIMSGLLTALRRNPDLARLFEDRFLSRKIDKLKTIFERARDRGEVAEGHDLELLATVGPAVILNRLLLTGRPVTRRYVTRVVDDVILPLASAAVSREVHP